MKTLIAVVALTLLAPALKPAVAQTGTAPFCLKTNTGQLNCSFASLAACEAARERMIGQCMTRSDAGGTTGLGDRSVPTPQAPAGQLPTPER
jgi:hypothetical protein